MKLEEKYKDIQLLLNPDEFEILSKLDKDNICSSYDWCGKYSDNCLKCPVHTLFNKIEKGN